MDIGTWHIDVWVFWALAAIPMAKYITRGMCDLAVAYLATYENISHRPHHGQNGASRWRGVRGANTPTSDTRD